MSKSSEFKKHTYTPNSFYDFMETVEKALCGDIAIANATDPVTAQNLADLNANGLTLELELKLQDSDGNVHEWFNRSLTATIATSGNGVAVDGDGDSWATIEFVKGRATMEIVLQDEVTGAAWVNEETVTITIADGQELLDSGDLVLGEVVLTVEAA